jgi:tetratricopeptide (TPR) repeat protein
MASTEVHIGNYDQAAKYFEKAKVYFEAVKNKRLISYMESSLGTIAMVQGDYQTASDRFEIVTRLGQESGNPYAIGQGLYDQATLAWEKGDVERAEEKFRELLHWSDNLESQRLVAMSRIVLVYPLLDRGDTRGAMKTLMEGIDIYLKWSGGIYDQDFVMTTSTLLGMVMLADGEYEKAARLLALANNSPVWNVRLMTPRQRREFDRGVEQTRAALGEEAFAAAWEAGRALTPEEMIAMGNQ